MIPKISIIAAAAENISSGCITATVNNAEALALSVPEKAFLKQKFEKEDICSINRYPHFIFFGKIKSEKLPYQKSEMARVAGNTLFDTLKNTGEKTVQLFNFSEPNLLLPFLEGLLLASYRFDKYKKEKDDFLINEIRICDTQITEKQITELANTTKAVFVARSLVNEPLSYLTAPKFSEEIEKLSSEAGFTLEVFNKKKIETLKMGGVACC